MNTPSYLSEINSDPVIIHPMFWWVVKVICGFLLITSLFLMVLYDLQPLWVAPRLIGQLLVITGASVSIWHYLLLKKGNAPNMTRPTRLIRTGGLYRWIRHPMYLADMIAYAGLFLLTPNIFAVFVLALAYTALLRQSKFEDEYLAHRFGRVFSDWRTSTKLVLPAIY